jgi:hypothetical protein
MTAQAVLTAGKDLTLRCFAFAALKLNMTAQAVILTAGRHPDRREGPHSVAHATGNGPPMAPPATYFPY